MQNVREKVGWFEFVSAMLQVWAASVLCISRFKLCNTICGFAIAFLFCLPCILHVLIIYVRGGFH